MKHTNSVIVELKDDKIKAISYETWSRNKTEKAEGNISFGSVGSGMKWDLGKCWAKSEFPQRAIHSHSRGG